MKESLLSILEREVNPALGCTGPTSVSYVAAVAKDAIGGEEIKSVRIVMDKDGYKNSISVGIPGTELFGLEIAAALGAAAGKADAGLEVLKEVTPEDEKKAKDLLPSVKVDIKWDLDGVGLYNEAFVETEKGTGHAIVRKTHTNTVLKEANGEILFQSEADGSQEKIDYSRDSIRQYRVKDFYEFAKSEPLKNLLFLKEAINLNGELAHKGFESRLGSGFGFAYQKFDDQTFIRRAKAIAAAAADARMAGLNLPAMSCATSGNVGITASIPLAVVAEELKKDEEELIRSIALSFLLVIYLKSHIGRLSAICACSIASSLGITAGTVLLYGGEYRCVEMAISSVIGSIGGILCDGAKYGCALKLANAVDVAIEAAVLAVKHDTSIKPGDGLVGYSADESIESIGRIAQEGMVKTDEVMARAIIERESRR